MKNKVLGIIIAATVAMLAACAQKGPVLLDNIAYQAPEGLTVAATKVVVGVGAFKDDREKTVSVVGKRSIRDDIENDLVVQGTVGDLVAKALKDALAARGIKHKDVPAWDLSADSIKAEGIDILIGGEIKKLWVNVLSKPLDVKVNAEVQLRVAAADAREKKIFRTLVLNSKLDRQDMAFSYDTTAGALSEALSSALNQLLNDEEFKSRIK